MLYVIAERAPAGGLTQFVKVGYVAANENNWRERFKQRVNKLQVGNPRQLVVIGKADGERPDEKSVHYRFESLRVRRPQATEWLHLEPGSAFAGWVDSVRIEPMTFGMSIKTATCPRCGGEHARIDCHELAADAAALRARVEAVANANGVGSDWVDRVLLEMR
jgi:hypothetical protein